MTGIIEKRARRLEEVDDMPPELRGCVHEFGYAIVHAFVTNGVTSPGRIRQLVHEVWAGARQPAQRQKSNPLGASTIAALDWFLIQNGCDVSATTLTRLLWHNGMALLPCNPTRAMIDASMNAVTREMPIISKEDKHVRRLRAAVTAAAIALWPHLSEGKQA